MMLYFLFELSCIHLQNDMTGHNCLVCGGESNNKCSACNSAYYCGRDCQIKKWNEHKIDCIKIALAKQREAVVDSTLMKSLKNMLGNINSFYGCDDSREININFYCKLDKFVDENREQMVRIYYGDTTSNRDVATGFIKICLNFIDQKKYMFVPKPLSVKKDKKIESDTIILPIRS